MLAPSLQLIEAQFMHYNGIPASLNTEKCKEEPNAAAKFYKSRSQEKTPLPRPEFFLLRSPLDRARSVLTYRSMCSGVGPCNPVVWIFSTSGFHHFFATKPVSSETSKAERWSNLATIVLLGTRGP